MKAEVIAIILAVVFVLVIILIVADKISEAKRTKDHEIKEYEELTKKYDEARIFKSPYPCVILKHLAGEGDLVEEGSSVIMVESMKMEIDLKSHISGHVHFLVKPSDTVNKDAPLFVIE